MQPDYFSATVIAMTLILSATVMFLTQWMSKVLKNQTQSLMTLANLLASKDLAAFQSLQTFTSTNLSQPNPSDEAVSPLNDAVIADRLAKEFEGQGLDPKLAYAQTDDEMLADFGGPEAFRTF